MKKCLSLILALVLCLGILAGCSVTPAETSSGNQETADGSRPNLNGATITMYAPSTELEDGECYVDRTVQSLLNCNWEVHTVGTSWNEVVIPMMAEGKVPDISCRNSYTNVEIQFGEDGAYINIYDYLDKMPNIKAFLEDPVNSDIVKQYTVREGVMYCLPIEREVDTNIWSYLYRSDIFEANNLTWPTNQEELYNTLVKLKELYPNSYPLVIRPQSTDQWGLQGWAHTWGATWQKPGTQLLTLDENGEYYYGLISDEMKEMVIFLKKLLDEGLLHPSYTTIDSAGWNEVLSNGTSFITFDKVTKILDIAPIAAELDPNWTMTSGEPFAMGSNGIAATSFAGKTTVVSYAIGNNDNLENTLQFIDWMYSEEGIHYTNWGIEGESYEVVNGEKQYKEEFLNQYDVFSYSGLNLHFLTARTTWDSYAARVDADLVEAMERALPYKYMSPEQVVLTYTEEEQDFFDTYAVATHTYALGEYIKFALGQRDISEWDAYVKEVEENYHLAEMKKIHEAALERALGK